MKYQHRINILFFIFGFFSQSAAQMELLPDTRYVYVSTGFNYQMFRLRDYTNPITQAAFPISLSFPMSRRVNLTITHTPALSRWEAGQGINGLSDTWLLGTYVFWDRKAMVNMGVGVPTGKTKLTNDQFNLSMFLSRNALRFQLPVYGQGLCAKVGFAVAYPLMEYIVVGIGGQYLHRRPYFPVLYTKEEFLEPPLIEYDPGDEFSGQFGIDFQIIENFKAMADVVVTYYGRDLWGEDEVYRSGLKVSTNFAMLYRLDKNYIFGQMTYRHRGKIEEYHGVELIEETQNSNGYQVDVDIVAKIMDLDGSGILILGDGRFYGENEVDQRGKATILGGGFGANVKLSDITTLDFHFKYLAGNYTFTEERSVEGMDTFIGVTFRF